MNSLNIEIGGSGNNPGHLRVHLLSDAATTDFYGATNISDDEWHHVALVRSGAGTGSDLGQLFVDYELDGERALNTGELKVSGTFILDVLWLSAILLGWRDQNG